MIYVLYVIETEGINDGDKIEKEVRIDWLLMVTFVVIVYQCLHMFECKICQRTSNETFLG